MLSFTATGIPYNTPDGCAADAWATSDLRSSLIGVRQAFSRLTLTMRSAAAWRLPALRWDRSRSGVLELPELGHQEEAVSEGRGELGRSEREGPGLHFVGAEPHRIRARHERLHRLTRRYRVDLGDVLEDPGHLLGQERQCVVAYVELREPRDPPDFVMRDAHALSHSRSSPA